VCSQKGRKIRPPPLSGITGIPIRLTYDAAETLSYFWSFLPSALF